MRFLQMMMSFLNLTATKRFVVSAAQRMICNSRSQTTTPCLRTRRKRLQLKGRLKKKWKKLVVRSKPKNSSASNRGKILTMIWAKWAKFKHLNLCKKRRKSLSRNSRSPLSQRARVNSTMHSLRKLRKPVERHNLNKEIRLEWTLVKTWQMIHQPNLRLKLWGHHHRQVSTEWISFRKWLKWKICNSLMDLMQQAKWAECRQDTAQANTYPVKRWDRSMLKTKINFWIKDRRCFWIKNF